MNALLSGSMSVPRAAASVDHGWSGFMLPWMPWMRMLAYWPARMASRLKLRDIVCTSGNAMLL